MAKAADGLIEAVYKPDKKFVWAVQWHPEFSYKDDENSKKIFSQAGKSSKIKLQWGQNALLPFFLGKALI